MFGIRRFGITRFGEPPTVEAQQSGSYTAPVSGGISTGGTAPLGRLVIRIAVVSGGIQTGGEANKSRTKTFAVSGGILTGGAATTSKTAGGTTYTASVSGGLQTGGSAAIARVVVRTVVLTGGLIQTGGTAAKALVQSVAPLGGLQIAGTAPVSRVKATQASGGILTGGTALKALTKAPAASGGVVTAGSATTSLQSVGTTVFTYAATGGIVLGGSAATSLLPAVVETQGGGWPRRVGYSTVERITRAEEPKRNFSRPGSDLVSEFLAKSRAYRGKGSVNVGGSSGIFSGSAGAAFVPAPVTFEAVGSGSMRLSGQAESFRYDPFLLARFEDLDLMAIG